MATPKSTFIICTRGVDDEQFNSEPGETTFLRVPAAKKDYSPASAMDRDKWRKAVIAAADGDDDEITGSTGNILFFVHGYNNDVATVLWRTRELQKSLATAGWKGLVVAFDWPSDNSTLGYLEDRFDASQVAQRLIDDALRMLIDAQFPSDSDAKPCTINVHMLGHSTGAYVIMEAFANAAKKGEFFKKTWRIGQVAFIGGDVSRASLETGSDWAQPMYDRIFRLTNYSNGFDKVLGASNMKRLGTAPRAGRVGLSANVPRQAVNVDCSEYFKSIDPSKATFVGTFNHSWHIGDPTFALDLALTLESAMDRLVIPTRRLDGSTLTLIAASGRPEFQAGWDEDRPVP